MSCTSHSDPCCPTPGTPLDPAQEPLDSEVGNLVESLYGTITKSLDPITGEVVWTLPCNLNAGIVDNPRLANEGLLCFFFRMFTDGVAGAVGPAGPDGAAGPEGPPAYTTVSAAFTNPTIGSPLFSFSVVSTTWVAPGMILFVENVGWVRVESKSGLLILATLLVPISSPPPTVPVGAGVAPTGPQGADTSAPTTVATPTASPVAGTYGTSQTITLATTTSGAQMYYTLDGSTPTILSTAYTVPFGVAVNTTVKVFAVRAGFTDSAVATFIYGIRVVQPVATPAAGTYSGTQSVVLSSVTAGASIRYTIDGSTPSDTVGTVYSGAVSVATTETLKAIAYLTGMTNSTVLSAAYTITPTFTRRWGNSTSTVLNEAGILALANSSTVTSIAGTYDFGAFAAGTYQFFAWPDSAGSPRVTDGFFLSPFPVDIAGAAESYNDGTQNGWAYELVTVSGVLNRLYRTQNQLEGGVILTVQV